MPGVSPELAGTYPDVQPHPHKFWRRSAAAVIGVISVAGMFNDSSSSAQVIEELPSSINVMAPNNLDVYSGISASDKTVSTRDNLPWDRMILVKSSIDESLEPDAKSALHSSESKHKQAANPFQSFELSKSADESIVDKNLFSNFIESKIDALIDEINTVNNDLAAKKQENLNNFARMAFYELAVKNQQIQPRFKNSPVYNNSDMGEYLNCVRQRESGGNYGIHNTEGSGASGAYQFLQSTWNSTVRQAGRIDLIGKDPASVSPADQDAMAIFLYKKQGRSPWITNGC